jgi:5-formyltetrahydrofolate cyclo-ligase
MEKQRIREEIWELLERRRVVCFPKPVYGRIPNFIGAEAAAERLIKLRFWRKARAIKSNPDSPQRAVRLRALAEGKIVYMAVPRLRDEKCFLKLDPEKIHPRSREYASTIRGAFEHGEQIYPWEMEKVDLVVAGSVAVNAKGARVGKGGGYSDIEYAIGREYGIIDESTPVITTVHPLQIVTYEIPMTSHDVAVSWIITQEGIMETHPPHTNPSGILWHILDEGKINKIPILKRLRECEK